MLFQKGFHPIMMCSVGYSPKAVLRILKQPKSRDGVKSHYYKGLFTNYVDKILAFLTTYPPAFTFSMVWTTEDGSVNAVPQILYGQFLILGVFGSCMF